MDKIKQLQIKKLLKELEFVESDFDYKSEVMSIYDAEFMNQVDSFLEEHPELKEKYESKMNKELEEAIKKDVERAEESENENPLINEDSNSNPEKSAKVKKIYREIVKLTHPDRIKDKKLNDFYIKATEFYEENDLSGLYFICDQLNIEYEIDENDDFFISGKITKLKERISFMESTYTWQWHSAENEVKKQMLIVNYIQMQMMS